MKLVIPIFLVQTLVFAQMPPKPATQVPSQFPNLPPGWVVLIPTEGVVKSPLTKPFQLPKDWVSVRPEGVPNSAPAAIAGLTTKSGQVEWVPSAARIDAEDALVMAQSLAILSLKTRIDQLEARIKELETRNGGKK